MIIVSDHGMSSIDQLHKINLGKALNMANIKEITEGGAHAYIWPVLGQEENVSHLENKNVTGCYRTEKKHL